MMRTAQIVFSPTGGTAKVAEILTRGWKNLEIIDLLRPDVDYSQYRFSSEDRVLLALPSFSGLAPAVALERLNRIAGNGAKCVVVCVYGNRAYEDTLIQMVDAVKECGFIPVAAIAAIAEHSIVRHYAENRPDDDDIKELTEFAAKIVDKNDEVGPVPGNRPYKTFKGVTLVPKVSNDCAKCGACAEKCPVKAIDPQTLEADPKLCISCMRCVAVCPAEARKLSSVVVNAAALAIKIPCSIRKNNELYL